LLWGGSLFGAERGLYISPLYALIAAAGSFTLLTALRLRLEAERKNALKNAFSRYLAPEMVRRITEHPEHIKLMGEERELSILFLDIRGFTGIASRLSPEELVSLLNRVFTPVTRIIREYSGTVDKFVGDACMAFWNAPLDVPGHALKAASAAVRILDAVAALGAESPPLPVSPVRIGIGLHFGNARVGNMGTEELLNYTSIGDTVNIASRIEGLCKEYSAACLVSGPFVAACLRDAGEGGEAGFVRRAGDLAFCRLDSVIVRGHDRPLDIYAAIRAEILGEEGQALFSESCRLRKAGDFTAAREKMLQLHAAYPDLAFPEALARRCKAEKKSNEVPQ
jgi:adenylate cyclase